MKTKLSVTHNEAKQKISLQISRGKALLSKISTTTNGSDLQKIKADFKDWDDYNYTLLQQLFTTDELHNEYLSHNSEEPETEYGVGIKTFGITLTLPFKVKNRETTEKFKNSITLRLNKLKSIKKRLKLFETNDKILKNTKNKKVFIVHGHNHRLRDRVTFFLEQVGVLHIILDEQPNRGQTLIEKFEKHAQEAGYAIILYTPDDQVLSADITPKGRPRQNVVFEFGHFIGKLGRDKICILYKEGTEISSDIDGIAYIPFDDHDAWKMKLAQELKSAGFPVDFNDLIKN